MRPLLNRVSSLCARRQDLLEQAGAQDNTTLITNDWQEVIHHSEVNLVLICTPDALHHEALLSCAKAGKYVFCEKPVGTNVQQAFDMYTAVQQAGLAHYVPFWSRYQQVLQQARQILTAGRLGDIRGVVYRWHNPRPLGMPFTWRDDAALSSAGSIADVGSHAYDTMRWLLGTEAIRVMAHADVITAAKPDLGDINLTEAIDWGASPPAEPGGKTRQATAFDYASHATAGRVRQRRRDRLRPREQAIPGHRHPGIQRRMGDAGGDHAYGIPLTDSTKSCQL